MVSVTARLLFATVSLFAVQGEQSPPAAQKQKGEAAQERDVVPRQPGDDVAKPLDTPLAEKARLRVEAQSWFMAGKVEQREGRTQQAYEAFRKALDIDPEAVAIYRELIPVAFQLNRTQEAAELARKAVELDPNDFEILQQLSRLSLASNRLADAVRYGERALKSDRLDKKSVQYVFLNLELVRPFVAARQLDKAVKACDVLFDALKDPAAYDLDARAQRVLAQQTELIGNVFAASGKADKAIAVFEEQGRVRGDRPGTHNLNLAKLYFSTRDFEKAEEQLLLFFQTKPRDVSSYQLYRQVLTASDRGDEVLESLEKIAEGDRRNAALQYFLADLYVEAMRLDEAEAMIRRAMRSSGNPSGYLGLAEIYRQQNNPEKLLDALSKASKAGVDASPLVGRIASDEKVIGELLTLGENMVDDNPDAVDYQLSYLLGRMAAAAEKSEAAVKFFRTALQLGTADQVPVVSLDLGTQLLFADEYAEAARVFENALSKPAQTEEERRRTVFLLYRLAQAREFADETDQAIKALKRAQAMPEGDLPLLHYQEGWTWYHAREIDKAEAKLQMVLQKYRSDPDTTMRTRLLLASIHSQQRNFDTAIREFENIIRDYADRKDTVRSAKMSLSSLYLSKGDQLKAEKILEEVLQEDPDDPGVNNDLGYLYADQGKNLERAEQMIRKAVEASPENAAYLDSLGWVLFRRGKFAEAVEILERAVGLPDGKDSTIVEHLGDNYEKLGRKDEARRQWEKALEIESSASYPDESVLKRLREKLSSAAGAGGNNSDK